MIKFSVMNMIVAFMLLLLITGCGSSGQAIPVGEIEQIDNQELKEYITGLYNNNPVDVYRSMKQIASHGDGADKAVPFLASMLTDRRIAKIKKYSLVSYKPLFKESAITLAMTGEKGVEVLMDNLKATSDLTGIEDDFYREGIAEGLNRAITEYGYTIFQKMNQSDRVLNVIGAVNACLRLSNEPGRWDKSDPRKNLKLYKHFNDVSYREGLLVYIKVLGMTGDDRALDVLSTIVPISVKSKIDMKVDGFNRFHRAAAVSQYSIRPVPIIDMRPGVSQILLFDFISSGRADYIAKMLEEGLIPDIKALSGEPAISFAFRKDKGIFNQLVGKGADVNCRLSKNDTMLIRASRNGDYDFAEALLEKGAQLDLINNSKENAITVAFTTFLDKWDGGKKDKHVENYFKLLQLLNKSGSPPVPVKLIKSVNKKKRKIIADRTGITEGKILVE